MKSLRIFLFSVLFLSFFVSFAFASDVTGDPDQALRSKIVHLIGTPDLSRSGQDIQAKIVFTINQEKEIVVLQVVTTDRGAEDYIKHKLNYQSVPFDGIKAGERYILHIRFKAK